LTAIPSPTAPITRCRRRSAARATGRPTPFWASLYADEQPRAVVVAWDTLEEETYRHEAFPAYQSGRDFDDDIVEQLAVIPDFVTACGFANARGAGFEADDFLAAAAAGEEKRRGRMLVASGDRDSFQLASPRTTILYPVRGGGVERIGPAEVFARYGIEPKQVPDFIALRGGPVRQIARRARRRPRRRGVTDPPLRQPRGGAESRTFPQTGGGASALQIHRHHGPQGAAAQTARPDAELGQGRSASARVGA
jgi:hypothetical protein